MISVSEEGGQVINYSDRFTLTGMVGTFPAAVVSGLASVTGTDGPATDNEVSNAAGGASAAAAGGSYTVAYNLQTGLTKYAPMQPVPPTSITAKSATPLYPTSAYTVATTWMATPKVATTLTLSQTFSVSSVENTVRLNSCFCIPQWHISLTSSPLTGRRSVEPYRRHAEVPQQVEGLDLWHGRRTKTKIFTLGSRTLHQHYTGRFV